MLAEMLFRPFEMLVNRGLAQSTSAQTLARGLEGRILGLAIDGTPLDLRLKVSAGRVCLALPDGAAPDATLSGTLLGLGRLLRDDPQAAVREGAVRMTGDTDIANRFRELLRFAAPDIEEELARLLGDPLARQLGNAARAAGAWGSDAGRSVARSVADYLQDEARVVATGCELRAFAEAVDTLANDVARSEARVARLEEGQDG
ncbi:MAG: hypothetical protein DYH19_08605 [Gammaproteobacteria bacterium PRO8]|nr:hypothetical protein [Gammaproteobacteria bacterium PRO8]